MRAKNGTVPTIVEAFTDENIFGHYFPTPFKYRLEIGQSKGSWERWKVFLKSVYGIGIYGSKEKEIWRICTDRGATNKVGFDEFYAIVGRRGGKSSIVSLIAVYEAVFKDWKQYLKAGERATIFCMATKRDQAQIVFRHCRALLSKNFEHMIIKEHGECLSLDNQVDIVTIPARFAGLRGFTVAGVILDEFAFFPTEEYSNPAKEIIRSLRPALLPGAKLMGISTPYSKLGFLFDVFKKYYGREDSRVLIWKATTDYMNPVYRAEKIAEEYDEDPISARTEYGAEFRDDVSTYITEADLELLIASDVFAREPNSEKRYFGFVDVSGARNDSFAFAIAHPEPEQVVLDFVYEMPPPFDVNEEVFNCSEHMKRYGLYHVNGDKYSGEVYKQKFREHGVLYNFSNDDKSQLFLEFQRIVNLRRADLLDNQKMKSQFVSLDRKAGKSGKDSVEKSPGGHDDLANAVAGAVVLAYRRLLARPSADALKSKTFRRYSKSAGSSKYNRTWHQILDDAEKQMKEDLIPKKESENEKPVS